MLGAGLLSPCRRTHGDTRPWGLALPRAHRGLGTLPGSCLGQELGQGSPSGPARPAMTNELRAQGVDNPPSRWEKGRGRERLTWSWRPLKDRDLAGDGERLAGTLIQGWEKELRWASSQKDWPEYKKGASTIHGPLRVLHGPEKAGVSTL